MTFHIFWKFDNSEYFHSNFSKGVPASVLVGDLISKFVLVELTVCTTQLVQILHGKNHTK